MTNDDQILSKCKTYVEDAIYSIENADIITACASKAISEYADEHKPYYYGVKVPIFCASDEGRKFLDIRLEHIGKPLTTKDYPRNKEDAPYKLI